MYCQCGHLIRDTTDNLPYKALFFADGDYAASFERHITFCAGLIQARDEGRQDEFITSHFGENYPKDLSVEDVVSDNVAGLLAAMGHLMYECENCGRLYLQPFLRKNQYVSYVPEGEVRGVLRPWKQEPSQETF
jgi:hypothetical protein